MSIESVIKSQARSLGFQLTGITRPEPPPHLDVYKSWLGAGRHGQMAYLASERAIQLRSNPRQILPECQAILVLGTLYFPPQKTGSENDQLPLDHKNLSGRISSYAWGDDYHSVLIVRMHALVKFIETQIGHSVPHRWYTDTGPILERDFAQRASLGWIGRNTCLINPKFGSYFFLSEILLGIELNPDQPFTADRCGSCTRCIDACPTACILPNRTIDARRCISYLTIELKGAIQLEMRSQVGGWVFGCDICQQVCPWNQRFAPLQGDPKFAPRPAIAMPDLIQELSLTPEHFNSKFKDNPLKRARRRGYLRNVAVALGNRASPSAVPALSLALHHETEPLVRAHAAWALGQIKGSASIEALISALKKEQDEGVLVEIQSALTNLGIKADRLI